MNTLLDFTLDTFENDFCKVDVKNQNVIWKNGMFNPKMQKDILYWFNNKNN